MNTETMTYNVSREEVLEAMKRKREQLIWLVAQQRKSIEENINRSIYCKMLRENIIRQSEHISEIDFKLKHLPDIQTFNLTISLAKEFYLI